MNIPSQLILERLMVVLPWPDSALMPNRKNGRHWASTQRAKLQAQAEGGVAARQALGRNAFRTTAHMPVSIRFVAPDRRKRDIDNLLASMKPQIDGIARALGVDDSRFRPITLDDAIDKNKKGFVIVEILSGSE